MDGSRRLWFLGFALLLSSCAGLKDWDEYEKYQAEKNFSRETYERKEMEKIAERKVGEESLYEKEVKEKMVKLLREPPSPIKAPDTVLRVLILPYVDKEGNLNAMKYVFLRVEEGRWILGDYLIHKRSGIKLLTPLKDEGK